MRPHPEVLIAGPYVSRPDQPDVVAVGEALARRGAGVSLFDFARPETLRLDGFDAIWRAGPMLFVSPVRVQKRVTNASWEAAFIGELEAYRGLLLDPHATTLRAENKPFQLCEAAAVGLDCPRTVVTSDPDEVQALAAEMPLVMKLLVPQFLLQPENDDAGDETRVFFTRAVPATLDGLEVCPMIFQERLAKARDVRVTFVGERFFPVSVDPNLVEKPQIDWRADALALAAYWRAHELPFDVERKLQALRSRLGLRYGAFDLVETPDGRHVFLEVNSFARFGFLGAAHAQPVADALAEVLCSS